MVAVGKANFIKADQIKEGAIVIDVGVNRLESGKLCGDVQFDEAKEKASFITLGAGRSRSDDHHNACA